MSPFWLKGCLDQASVHSLPAQRMAEGDSEENKRQRLDLDTFALRSAADFIAERDEQERAVERERKRRDAHMLTGEGSAIVAAIHASLGI